MNSISKVKNYLPEVNEFRNTLKLHQNDKGSHILQLFDVRISIILLSSHIKQFSHDSHAKHRLQKIIGKYKKILKYCQKQFVDKTILVMEYFDKLKK